MKIKIIILKKFFLFFINQFFQENIKEENNEIIIRYNIKENENKIKIFGKDFIKNNKNICKIIYEDKEYELQEYFEFKNIKKNK